MKNSVVILCAGGPAPGMNSVISSVTKTFLAEGWDVIGLHGGYGPLFKPSEENNYLHLDLKTADRIHGRGGSTLRMSRYKPKDDEFRTDFFVKHNVKLLVTVGGDDTASTAGRIGKYLLSNNITTQTIHVPKTIDNDLPLPRSMPTFGFHTAMEEGSRITLTITEDARTTGNWFVMSAMGREAGHLAFGIAAACHSSLAIVPEMFNKVPCTFDRIVNLMISSIIKRTIMGLDYGVIIISEGVFHFISDEDIKNSGIHFTFDDHGHPELGTISKGQVFNTLLQKKCEKIGLKIKTRPNDLGYELRCVRPIAYDLEYCTLLGTGVLKLYKDGSTGCMVTLNSEGKIEPLYLKDIQDAVTGKVKPRLLEIEADRVKIIFDNVFHYLEEKDYEPARHWIKSPEEYDLKKILNW